jgi:cell migration-inducing and hyaluronan-binding protein
VPNELRDAGALSYLLFTSFGMSTSNSVEGLTFVNAQPVSFPPLERRWASDYGGMAAYKSAAFHDLDGSVSGIPGAYIVLDNGIAADEDACEIKPSWGAAVCTGDMGRLSVGGVGGGGGGRGGRGGRGRGGFGGGGAAADPIVLSRNGREFEYPGQATLGSGAEIKVDTARESVSLSLSEMDEGSYVILELPGFTTSAGGTEQGSLAALRDASETSYYRDDEALWVKLVVPDAGGAAGRGGQGGRGAFGAPGSGTSVSVSR